MKCSTRQQVWSDYSSHGKFQAAVAELGNKRSDLANVPARTVQDNNSQCTAAARTLCLVVRRHVACCAGLQTLKLGLSRISRLALALPHLAHLDAHSCGELVHLDLHCPLLLHTFFHSCWYAHCHLGLAFRPFCKPLAQLVYLTTASLSDLIPNEFASEFKIPFSSKRLPASKRDALAGYSQAGVKGLRE